QPRGHAGRSGGRLDAGPLPCPAGMARGRLGTLERAACDSTMSAIAASAFALGLFSSVHCIGMCGPIALAVPSARLGWAGRTADALLLNAGRIATNALLGLLFGTFGRGLRLAGLQQGISIALGALILAGLLFPAVIKGQALTGQLAKWTAAPRR